MNRWIYPIEFMKDNHKLNFVVFAIADVITQYQTKKHSRLYSNILSGVVSFWTKSLAFHLLKIPRYIYEFQPYWVTDNWKYKGTNKMTIVMNLNASIIIEICILQRRKNTNACAFLSHKTEKKTVINSMLTQRQRKIILWWLR